MFKASTIMKRQPGMAVEAFQNYWLNEHAAYAGKLPGLRRYMQSHALLQGYRKGDLPCDGLSEMWFDTRQDWENALASQAGQAMLADLHAFTKPDALIVMPIETHVVVDGAIPNGAVKNIELVNCRPGMDLDDFRAYWKNVHGPLASGITAIRRYEQDHLARAEYDGAKQPPLDGLAITWFDSTASMKQGATTPVYAETRADEANFLPDGHLPFIITTEHEIVPLVHA
ncbi:EthD family reductase [Pollutimonas harenae]|uniref:EthD family reductase n=1 Tax=Pollutimonas harenae TaxID=657015 RepID=A0A853GRR8_9BURK|nr:EthD family reductase [Pollutimonas harenae]NYT84857.1 EthD family reductase [Pollutimonas harenae]TEA72745.1 EthD family reductase [Pollutimonas harenae]